METLTADGPRPLLIVGGCLALDLANTVDAPDGVPTVDYLDNSERAAAWAANRGLLTYPAGRWSAKSGPPPGLRRLRMLRQAVQAGFTAVADGQPFPDAEWYVLRRAIAQAADNAELVTDHGRPRLGWSDDDFSHVGHAVAISAYDLLTGPLLPRVKRCAGCHWLYLDESKNGSRRWCSMADCGTQAKMRRYVDRRAARRHSARA